MQNKLFKKGLVIGIIILLIAIVVLPSTGGVINKNTKVEEQQAVVEETSASITNGDDADWWTMYKYDLQNTGNTTSTGPETNKIKWTFEADFSVGSAPAVVYNRVYFGSDDLYFYCLNAINGEKFWSYYTSGGSSNIAPCVYDGKVYLTGVGYYFYCWDAYDGDLLWSFEYDWAGGSSPSIAYGNVYFSKRGKMYCLDADDGDMIWNYTMGSYQQESDGLVIDDGKVYIGSGKTNGTIYCFNAYNGSVIWSFDTNSPVRTETTLADGKLYCGSNGLWCLNADTGNLIWHKDTAKLYCGPAVAYGKLYFIDNNGTIYCLDAETGNESWTLGPYGFQQGGTTPATVADGKVYISVFSLGKLLCLDAIHVRYLEKPNLFDNNHLNQLNLIPLHHQMLV